MGKLHEQKSLAGVEPLAAPGTELRWPHYFGELWEAPLRVAAPSHLVKPSSYQ